MTNSVIIQSSAVGRKYRQQPGPVSPFGSPRGSLRLRRGGPLERVEVGQGVLGGLAAHLPARPQAVADLGPVRAAEDPAEVVRVELDAAHAGRLAVRHAG